MIKFFKMHGVGNDYIFIDETVSKKRVNYGALSRRISRRNYSVGSDGLIVLSAHKNCDAKMQIFNSDGTPAKMCGNASRCAVFYLAKKLQKNKIKIKILNKIIKGKIIAESRNIADVEIEIGKGKLIKIIERQIFNKFIKLNIINVGNLHAVVFVKNFNFNIEKLGEFLSNLKDFKDGINVEFVKVTKNKNLRIKVYERGSKVTLACGSGACASALCYKQLTNAPNLDIKTILDGGKIRVIVDEDNNIKMQGKAEYVFSGEMRV